MHWSITLAYGFVMCIGRGGTGYLAAGGNAGSQCARAILDQVSQGCGATTKLMLCDVRLKRLLKASRCYQVKPSCSHHSLIAIAKALSLAHQPSL